MKNLPTKKPSRKDSATGQKACDKAWAKSKLHWKFNNIGDQCRLAIAYYKGWTAAGRALRAASRKKGKP